MITDRDYVERCRDGTPNDFRFLVERYQGAVFAYAVTRLTDRAQAAEVTQEAFVRAYFALKSLKNPDAFHAWVLGIAGRVALESCRQRRRRAEVTIAGDVPAEIDAEDFRVDGLDAAIAALPEAQRHVVLLRYFGRLSCREIAEKLELPLGTVTKTLSRAYEGLRAALGAHPEMSAPMEEQK